MGRYILVRIGHAIIALFGVSLLVFFVIRLSGDPAQLMLPAESTAQQLQEFRHTMGFDRPLPAQYGAFLARLVRGDLGQSLRYRTPASTLVAERMPATLKLTVAALLLSVLIAIPAGVVSAVHRNRVWDDVATFFALLGQSMPVFWIGILFILFFSVQLRLFPSSGSGTWLHLVLPAVTLGAYSAARITRVVRSEMLETLGQDYVRTARAKGLSERDVTFRHALRNALLPVVTLIGLELGTNLGGAVVTETVFAWPGVGRLLMAAISSRDYPLVQAITLMIALVFLLVNLTVDLLYAVIDPRIRYN